MKQSHLNKPMTRRAREYFEVLDELCAEGYITHEEWIVTDLKAQAETPKMTNRIIEDALLEHGYSKGSANEMKKYRLRWLDARGIDYQPKEGGIHTKSEDPLLGIVAAVRQKLAKEVQEEADAKIQKSEERLAVVDKQYAQKRAELEEVLRDLKQTEKELLEMQSERDQCLRDMINRDKEVVILRTSLKDLNTRFDEYKAKEVEHRESVSKIQEERISHLQTELAQLKQTSQTTIDDLRDHHEQARHTWIVEQDALQVSLQKSEQATEKSQWKIDELSSGNKQLIQDLKKADQKVSELEQELKMACTVNTDLEKEKVVLEEKVSSTERVHDIAKASHGKTQLELLSAQKTIGRLEEKLQQLPTKKHKTDQEIKKRNKHEHD